MGHIFSTKKIMSVWNFERSQQQLSERIWLRCFAPSPKLAHPVGADFRYAQKLLGAIPALYKNVALKEA